MLCMQETSQLKKSLHWIHLAVVPISYVPLHATHATSFTVVDVPGGSALNLLDRKDENASNKHSEILLSPPKHWRAFTSPGRNCEKSISLRRARDCGIVYLVLLLWNAATSSKPAQVDSTLATQMLSDHQNSKVLIVTKQNFTMNCM